MKKIYVVYGVNSAGMMDDTGKYVATFRGLAEFDELQPALEYIENYCITNLRYEAFTIQEQFIKK